MNALSAKPLGQLAPANVADLFAIDELEDLATTLRVRLKGFAERIGRAVGDLPNGEPFLTFANTIGELDDERVPESMRRMFEAEAGNTKRTPREQARIAELLAQWAETPPVPFEMAAPKAVHQLPTAGKPTHSGMRVRGGAGVSVKRTSSSEPKAKVERAPKAVADPARQAWLRQVCRERLAGARDRGLQQVVLIAGVRHRARDRYPDLTPKEITDVLNDMAKTGEAKVSALRWTLTAARF